jgi:hypothetical protein
MKKMLGFAASVFAATVTSVLAAEPVDFHATNPVLQSITDVVISGDQDVEFAYPLFDETYSSFEKQKLKYDLQGALKNTPWLEGGRATVLASSTYAADRTAGHVGIAVTGRATVKTDVLALIRYSGYLALKKADITGAEFGERLLAHLKRVSVARSLDEVNALLISGKQLALEIQQSNIDKRAKRIACLEDGTCTEGMPADQVAQAIASSKTRLAEERQCYQTIGLMAVQAKKEGDKVVELSVISDDLSRLVPLSKQDQFQMLPGKSVATFTAETVTASSEGFVAMELKRLDKINVQLQDRLVGVQNGVAEEKDKTQKDYREALIKFKKVIHGKDQI